MSTATRGWHGQHGRGGFTLVELATVVMIVGILATIAIPTLKDALLKADAARLVGDAHTVSLATYEFLVDNGRFPNAAAPGTLPPELAGVLPDNLPFSYKGVTYQWFSFSFPNSNNVWRTRSLGVLLFDYSQRREMGDPMRSYAGADAFWTTDIFYFVYRG